METRGILFREIYKNTWLKRLTIDNKKITVGSGSKKSDRSWVVFCVHNDCEASLEGYVDMREASSHVPEWTINLQTVLHISHALIPSEQEYEFVITLSNDVIRFYAASWDMMQEWVDILRQKLQEMKILSPRENLYIKLPEIRAPLLPTRDPTSPLPAPPSHIPAALVPGVEHISSSNVPVHSTPINNRIAQPVNLNAALMSTVTTTSTATNTTSPQMSNSPSISTLPSFTAMSNTSAQNLMNMLSNPVTTYSSQLSETTLNSNSSETGFFYEEELSDSASGTSQFVDINILNQKCDVEKIRMELLSKNEPLMPNTFGEHVLTNSHKGPAVSSFLQTSDLPNESETSSSLSTLSAVYQEEPIVIPRPQTSRISSRDNQHKKLTMQPQSPAAIPTTSSEDIATTNITIIQVSSSSSLNSTIEKADSNFRSKVQIIPFDYSLPSSSAIRPIEGEPNIAVQVSSLTSLATGYGKIKKPSYRSGGQTQANSTSNITNLSSVRRTITNIPIGTDVNISTPMHYEQVFLTESSSANECEERQLLPTSKMFLTDKQHKSSSQNELHIKKINIQKETNKENSAIIYERLAAAELGTSDVIQNLLQPIIDVATANHNDNSILNSVKKQPVTPNHNLPSPRAAVRKFLTRGLTEACISTRQSRIDSSPAQRQQTKDQVDPMEDTSQEESYEQRRRSSSTSDAHGSQTRTLNNILNSAVPNENRHRMQSTSQMFHLENRQHSTRLTLREAQVSQLRREMVHPGGVRIQLRRKDCIGSIALVEAFGAVWVSGWKQKEHPILYNALHIGDQLISVTGMAVSTSLEVNRAIRNASGLYIEFIIRRVPFGRVYAIRREKDGQCLGLIRDGNSATIVDVIPKSLSARHGLPPKAQSCDGLSVSFWVLTEINGRPLNLFFKENEIRDRLNAVGRDISILVQPSDLVTELKKQLKSMRNYKEYIVQ